MSKEEERIKYFSSDVDSTLVKIIVVAVVFHFLVVAFFIGLHYVNLKPEPEPIPVFEMVQVSQPAPPKPVRPKPPEPPKPASPADRALAGASNASDYFSSLLGPGEDRRKDARTPAAPERHTTIVTPSTISRVREEQAASALAAEREAAAAREAELSGELEAQKAARFQGFPPKSPPAMAPSQSATRRSRSATARYPASRTFSSRHSARPFRRR